MPHNEKISLLQFTLLVAVFSIGTSILITPNVVAVAAKNDGWIADILNLTIGLLLVVFYNKLAKNFQQKNFFEYIDSIFGSLAGKIIAFFFFIFCILLSTSLIREVGDFATTQSYVETPIEAIIALIVIVVIFGARYGIETLARAGEIFFPWVLFLLIILVVTLIPEIKTERIFPILENGIKPILLATYSSIGIPYFEFVILLILIPYVNCQEKTGKALFTGVLIGGTFIFLITLFSILILGGEGTARNQFPSYTMAKSISIAKTIERIEAFLAAIWFISIYMKITLTFYCSALCLAHVFKLKNYKNQIYPLGMNLLFLSLYISPNIAYFRQFVSKTWFLFAGTYAILLPILLMSVGAFKNRKNVEKPE